MVHGDRVRIPSDLVEWAIAQCPRQVTLRGRGGQTVTLGDGSLSWHNVGGARDVYDPRSVVCGRWSVVRGPWSVVIGQGGKWARHCC